MRRRYEMTESQLAKLYEACAPRPAIMLNIPQRSPQQIANEAWQSLGDEMGFDWTTVQPTAKEGDRVFTAIPKEAADAS